MNQVPKKFGSFSGVFTPSILTILGVIMYLRLGWVVGEAGLITTLGIILVAHIISVSTGLSISSIATDKKIKTGGLYYMLSRSLGLPMGGAIGITLFIGTALSISLYLIGFAESFLSVVEIREFLGLQQDLNGFRIIGTTFILFLVLIAFISTSLAIKTQFFILAAIALSLISVFVGFFTNLEFHPEQISLFASGNDIPIEYIFGVFFPAVTGFTAGVAMSGDLKDPRKSIPMGSLGAIITGFLIYVGLAVGIAFFVDRDLLLNDSNFLIKVAWFAPLVLAGIWGATISSALGGILGGPRILQAISMDKIGPSLFGKGHGVNNEPRVALIVTFVIAEMGILIGDLNQIAGIVSMFYIAAYGFINLAFTLEQWASSDFRPSFKVSNWVGIIGFVASFAVMFKIDTFSMLLAIIIIMGIYFYLKKKELQLDFGDVWQSVWSSIIRMSLHKMDQKKLEERNWRPNILLFSGNLENRPHLISFGKWLVGKHGFMSMFELEEVAVEDFNQTKYDQILSTEHSREYQGIFSRRTQVTSTYEGILEISKNYGFSGVEPNTVMMGWGGQSKDSSRFATLLQQINDLDHNIIMMDYDQRVGFGKEQSIDIWWRGGGNNGNFSLQLVKFLLIAETWRNASVRLMIVNAVNDEKELICRRAESILENLRLNAEVRIINNQIEQRSIYEIIHAESLHSDLIFLGIPPIEPETQEEFIENINYLCRDLGTVILVRASSYFKDLQLGVKTKLKSITTHEKLLLVVDEDLEIPEVNLPENAFLNNQMQILWKEYADLVSISGSDYLGKIFGYQNVLLNDIQVLYKDHFSQINIERIQNKTNKQSIARLANSFIFKTRKNLETYLKNTTEVETDILNGYINFFWDESKRIYADIPEHITVHYSKEMLKSDPTDSFNTRYFKFLARFSFIFNKKDYEYDIRFKRMWISVFLKDENAILFNILNKWGQMNLQFVVELQKITRSIERLFHQFEIMQSTQELSVELRDENLKKLDREFERLKELNEASLNALMQMHQKHFSKLIEKISLKLKRTNVNASIILPREGEVLKQRRLITTIPNLWASNQKLLLNQTLLELNLQSFVLKLDGILRDTGAELKEIIHFRTHDILSELLTYIQRYSAELEKGNVHPFKIDIPQFDKNSLLLSFERVIDNSLRRIRMASNVFPDRIHVFSQDSFNDYLSVQYNNPSSVDIAVLRLIDYLIQSEFIGPMEELVNDLAVQLRKYSSLSGDIVRIINFSIGTSEHEIKELNNGSVEDIRTLLKEQELELVNAIKAIQEIEKVVSKHIQDRLITANEALSISVFIKSAADLKQYIKAHESIKRWSKIKKWFKTTNRNIQKQTSQVWYRHSKGVLLAQKLNKSEEYNQTRVNDVLNILDKISIDDQILTQIPFYYQQLFLRKEYYLNEFWVGRQKELDEFHSSLDRYNAGFKGGILVKGERGCGKTFFSQYAVNKFLPESNLYVVNPPYAGSSDPEDFKKTMQNVFEVRQYDQAFSELPPNSVIIFDSLEQWWERRSGGYRVLNMIVDLINRFHDKYLFIVNVNIHSFEVINSVHKIESKFLHLIDLDPFNSEQIKEIIMLRHKSGNLRFELFRKKHRKMHYWDNARLFAKYFNFSKGNVGVILDAWIANIVEVDQQTIYISEPLIPETSVLDNLELEWWLLLVQFILHKRMSIKRLSKITLLDESNLVDMIVILKRSGVVVETSADIYEINRFLYPHLRNKLIEKEMI
ncbi:MAG: hypothetical protein JEZ03_12270 [Bacteroidales bacterium]|nr:hypothetical protein [Bacteroidales bacterium]